MPCNDCKMEPCDAAQTAVLRTLLLINGAMFAIELAVGILAQSTGVLADSLDMLADALVYGVSLFAVGRGANLKILAARWSGWLQITIAVCLMFDIGRRAFGDSEPVSTLMLAVSSVALVANVFCLHLIGKHRDGGVHMRASWIFSKNDVLANLGVIVAAVAVAVTGSRWPDIIIGSIITIVVLRGGMTILQEAAAEKRSTCGQ